MVKDRTQRSGVTRDAGFTLIEIAIVLVIIGIILGAVLKGQEMINTAKIKNVADQYKGLAAAVVSYQDRYGVLPGDDNQATTRAWATGTCTTTNGNANGQIAESLAAAEHLACAGFITGSYNGTTDNMRHKFGGNTLVFYQTIQGRVGNLVRFDGLRAEDAQAVDRLLDDGVFNTGSCRASAAYTTGTVIAQLGCFF